MHRDAWCFEVGPLHPTAGLWEGQQPAAFLSSASNCKPKQHWQQRATIFNYTAGIISSLKNCLIALCLTTPSLSHSNRVLSVSPQQPWGPWNTSTSFLESFILLVGFLPQHQGSLDIQVLNKSSETPPKKSEHRIFTPSTQKPMLF